MTPPFRRISKTRRNKRGRRQYRRPLPSFPSKIAGREFESSRARHLTPPATISTGNGMLWPGPSRYGTIQSPEGVIAPPAFSGYRRM